MRNRTFVPWPILLLVALGAGACKDKSKAFPEPDPVSADPTGSAPPPGPVSSVGTLNGVGVEGSKDGPWEVRRAGTGSGDLRRGGKGSGTSGLGAPGGKPSPARAKAAEAPAPMAAAPLEEMEEKSAGTPPPPAAMGGAPMKAGSTDDNAAFDEFLTFLATWTDRAGMENRYQKLDVKSRRLIRVVDAKGNPVPAAKVRVLGPDRDGSVWDATTYGDGQTPFYGSLARGGAQGSIAAVEVSYGGKRAVASWTGEGDVTVKLPDLAGISPEIQLDVLFLIDTTGSMGDEIERVKNTLLRVTERLRELKTDFDLRYGAVLFRDIGDEYLTKTHAFTSDISAFDGALQQVKAGGGGDGPESVNQALAEAVSMGWREGAAKVAFLIGDAPPHMDYQGDIPYGDSAVKAIGRGLRVHSVAASGLDPVGTLVFRQTAQICRGKFIFIEYGTKEESARSHGVTGPVKSNNLDDIVFDQIREEVERWGKAG